jgi:DNA-binding IclR family transcriptional regulator
LKDVAQHAGMSASKAHFYMVSFKRVGLVTRHEVTGHYALGRYALDLGLSALRRLDLVEISRDAMRMLSSQISESVFLSVWGNHGPTIVFKVDGPPRIPMTLQKRLRAAVTEERHRPDLLELSAYTADCGLSARRSGRGAARGTRKARYRKAEAAD